MTAACMEGLVPEPPSHPDIVPVLPPFVCSGPVRTTTPAPAHGNASTCVGQPGDWDALRGVQSRSRAVTPRRMMSGP